jgi:lysyl-tRNA synthetase class II
MNTLPVHTSLDDLMAQRRAKLAALRQGGTNPFPARFDGAQPAASLLARYGDLPQGGKSDEIVSVAGRVMTCRDMGKTILPTCKTCREKSKSI